MKHETTIETPATAPAVFRLFPGDHFFKRMADVHKLVARRAYGLFSASGFTHGHDQEDWFRAESEILESFPLEVFETQNAITIKAALPDFSAKEIEVHVESQRLFISGQQKEKREADKGWAIRSEQHSKRAFRSIDLPAPIDPDKIRTTLGNGALRIELPRVNAGQKVAAPTAAA